MARGVSDCENPQCAKNNLKQISPYILLEKINLTIIFFVSFFTVNRINCGQKVLNTIRAKHMVNLNHMNTAFTVLNSVNLSRQMAMVFRPPPPPKVIPHYK